MGDKDGLRTIPDERGGRMPDYQTHCPVLHQILTQKMEAREAAGKTTTGLHVTSIVLMLLSWLH